MMKQLRIIGAIAIVLLAAMPSMASAQYHEQRLDKWLDRHQKVKADLTRNPDLIYNRQFRHAHPKLQEFMQNHPNVWGKLANNGRWGAYGPDHEWHEADWWHEHDRDWMHRNHPDWVEDHPDWRGDGDFDEEHDWDSREWREDQRADWVRDHRPGWDKHRAHEEAKEEKWEEKHGFEAAGANEHNHGHHGDHDHDKR